MGNTAEEKKASTAEERKRVLEFFVNYIKPGQFKDLELEGELGFENGKKIAAHIEYKYGGVWTPDILVDTVREIKNELWGLGIATPEQAKSNEQKTAEAAETARQRQVSEQTDAAVIKFLKEMCPLGLLVKGDLYPDSQNKLIAFIHRNYPNVAAGKQPVTTQQLCQAVATLGLTLDWFSREPGDVVLRGQPAPPSREEVLRSKLSKKALQEAGMAPREIETNHKTDGKLRDPREELRTVVKHALDRQGLGDPFKEKLEALCVMGFGRVDAGKTAQVRAIRVMKNGQVDWEASFRKADQLATDLENHKNRRANG
jgi:hypothetical protein